MNELALPRNNLVANCLDRGGTIPTNMKRELQGYGTVTNRFQPIIPPLFNRPLLFVKLGLRAEYQFENPYLRFDAPNSQN